MKKWVDPGALGIAAIFIVISLPFHYVFLVSIYEWVRYRPSVSLTTFLVVSAMGAAGLGLTWLAFALSTSGMRTTRRMRLPNVVLYVASAVFFPNALFQFGVGEFAWCFQSLVVSIGAFLLARKRGSSGGPRS